MHRNVLFIFVLLLVAVPALAHNVTIRLSFDMPGASIYANGTELREPAIFTNMHKPYIAANRTLANASSVIALVFTGLSFQSLAYTPAHTFTLTQAAADNKMLLVLANGSWMNIEARANIKFPKSRFGSFAPSVPTLFKSFALLQHQTIDIISDLSWSGQRSIAVRNVGTERLPRIAIEPVD